jgi:hypothetical protein
MDSGLLDPIHGISGPFTHEQYSLLGDDLSERIHQDTKDGRVSSLVGYVIMKLAISFSVCLITRHLGEIRARYSYGE